MNFESSNTSSLTANFKDAITAAAHSAQMLSKKTQNNNVHKPWFDGACISLRRKVLSALRSLRRPGSTVSDKQLYLALDKQYEHLKKQKKVLYFTELREKFSNLRDTKQFWAVVKQCKPRLTQFNQLPAASWSTFLAQVYSPRVSSDLTLPGTSDSSLDSPITSDELAKCLAHANWVRRPELTK